MSLCKRVREERQRQQLTQIGLADKAGVSRRTIAEIELSPAANPTRSTLEKIAGALNLSLTDLIDGATEAVA